MVGRAEPSRYKPQYGSNERTESMNELIMRNMHSAQYLYAAKKNFIRDNVISESHTKVVIGHMSDIHSDIKRFDNALKLFECFGADFVIHTGDTVEWNTDSRYHFFRDMAKEYSFPVYNCIGNHETFCNAHTNTNAFLHREFIDGTPGMVSDGRNGGYYYADNDKFALRLIALNDYDFECESNNPRDKYTILEPQLKWLAETLRDAAEKNLGVIIFSHESDEVIPAGANNFGFCQDFSPYPWGIPKPRTAHPVTDIVDAFRHGKPVKGTYTWETTGATVTVDESFDKKGDFICYLNGHTHGDYVGYIPSHPDQLSICMPCTGCFPEGYHNIGEELSDLTRIPGTVTEDLVNFYTLDRDAKTINIVRFGATVNYELKERIALSLKYGI